MTCPQSMYHLLVGIYKPWSLTRKLIHSDVEFFGFFRCPCI
jgi:hypothetical protein